MAENAFSGCLYHKGIVVGIKRLFHVFGGYIVRCAHGFGRHADHGGLRVHIADNHAARADFGAVADADVAEYGSVCAYHHAVAHFGMAVAALFA